MYNTDENYKPQDNQSRQVRSNRVLEKSPQPSCSILPITNSVENRYINTKGAPYSASGRATFIALLYLRATPNSDISVDLNRPETT